MTSRNDASNDSSSQATNNHVVADFFTFKSTDTKDTIPDNITHLKIHPSVEEIPPYTFENCKSLLSIEFPIEGLIRIGCDAFRRCVNLKAVNKFPSTLKDIRDYAFGHCLSLSSVTISHGLTIIGNGAFCNCASLEFVELPPTVEEIGVYGFLGCGSLRHLEIPSGVARIGKNAFSFCFALQSIDLHCTRLRTLEDCTFFECGLTHIRVPASVTKIDEGAFASCSDLISIELPEGLESICLADTPSDSSVVNDCRSLVNLVVPKKQMVDDLVEEEQVMRALRLNKIVDSFDDLVRKLKHRFDSLPVHSLCYYQSYHSLVEVMEQLVLLMQSEPSNGSKVDSFGMTPIHILALSKKPNISLMLLLMKVYRVESSLNTRDKFGSTPLDYLCMNPTPEAIAALEVLLPMYVAEHVRWLGLCTWRSDILDAMNEVLSVEWTSRRKVYGKLCFTLATYERLESISLLELALWKVKLGDCSGVEESTPKRPRLESPSFDYGSVRQSCRISSGADVVISHVLPFLGKILAQEHCGCTTN